MADRDDASVGGRAVGRRWYVDDRGSSAGPLDQASLEEMWRERKIDEDTLVWADGFARWLPLGDVPELGYLRAPQEGAARASTFGPPVAPGVRTLFRGEIEHRVGSAPSAPLPPPMPGLPVLSPPPGEGPGWRAELVDLRRATMTGLNNAWRSLQDARRGHRRMVILALVASCCALGAAGGLAFVLVRRPTGGLLGGDPAPAASAAPVGTVAPAVAAAGASPPAGVLAGPAQAEASSPQPAPTQAPAPREGAVAAASGAVHRAAPTESEEQEDEGDGESTAGADEEEEDDDGSSEASSAAGSSAAPLTKAEIIEATKTQVGGLSECIKQARRAGELRPQRYTFVLGWRIEADGSVSGARLDGPPELLATSLRACFETAIGGWRYRPAARESAVTNFPLAVNVP